jgi:trans-2,3-dihydro-3-hydroxyanthranilate isomerase
VSHEGFGVVKYLVYDVFTDKPFGGNQLAVFPDARGIPEGLLQKIATEFNFSEVTFVYPSKDDVNTARVRIFTPTTEVDFAGHPTIGTAIALNDLGYPSDMMLELGVGPIACKVSTGEASFTVKQPLDIVSDIPVDLVAKALGLSEDVVVTKTHAPVQASLGLPFVFIELKSQADLSSCQPHIETIRQGSRLYLAGLDFAIFAYVRDNTHIKARMFAPLDNIPEDPATGSASATLAALLSQTLNRPLSLQIIQGVDMGRPSQINVTTQIDPWAITVSGQAVKTMEGTFLLPKS